MTAFFIADPGAAFCVLEQNEVPSAESIERWREHILSAYRRSRGTRPDGTSIGDPEREAFLNRIFAYAQLGRDKHAEIRMLARMEVSNILRSLARQMKPTGKGRNRKGAVLTTGSKL